MLACACRGAREPVLLPLRDASPKTAVVLIPGLTGTKLRDVRTERVVWGNARSLFLPSDGGYNLTLPVGRAASERPQLEPVDPILEIRLLGVYKKGIYRSVVRLMEANGYRLGDLRSPRAEDDFFFFVYDWRLGVESAAQTLARQLERLRQARGDEPLRVALICQSDAALIARYYVKYAGAPIEDAEAGKARPPSDVLVQKLILLGSSNGGALRVLREMNRGRTYIPTLGRRWQPETLFSFPALYQSLPVYREDLFFGPDGSSVDVDLFDATSWERYGWSIFDGKSQRRVERRAAEDLFGSAVEQRRFLARMLDRAQRLHRLLIADVPGLTVPRYYSIQNRHSQSPDRALLIREDGRWRTYFASDRKVRKNPAWLDLAMAPGDGHATVASQDWLSPQEQAALAHAPVYIDGGGHFSIILEPATQNKLLEFLLEP